MYLGSGICNYPSNPGMGRRGFHSLVFVFFSAASKESSCQSHNTKTHSCSHSCHHHYLSCLLHLQGRNNFIVKFLQIAFKTGLSASFTKLKFTLLTFFFNASKQTKLDVLLIRFWFMKLVYRFGYTYSHGKRKPDCFNSRVLHLNIIWSLKLFQSNVKWTKTDFTVSSLVTGLSDQQAVLPPSP